MQLGDCGNDKTSTLENVMHMTFDGLLSAVVKLNICLCHWHSAQQARLSHHDSQNRWFSLVGKNISFSSMLL